MPARAVDIAINVNIIISSLFFVCSVYCLTITQTIFATFIATNPPTRSPIPSANISFSSFCLFFSLLCLCPYQMWERSRYVPAVAAAQTPSTTNAAPIVFSSFLLYCLFYHSRSDFLFLRNTKYPMIEPRTRSLSVLVIEYLADNESGQIFPVIRQSRKLPATKAVTKIMNFVLRLSFPVFFSVSSIVCVLFAVIVFVIFISPLFCVC